LSTITEAKWTKINLQQQNLYSAGSQYIGARQGAGMCQFSESEIMIVGGFNGKYLGDYFTFKIDPSNGMLSNGKKFERENKVHNLFPF